MFDVVCLASGGLDSTVCLKIFQRQGLKALPVFINYGQRNLEYEFASLQDNCNDHQLQQPMVFDLSSFGRNIRTGLTSDSKDVVADAFTPNRNLLFLTVAASVAHDKGCNSVALGFLTAQSAVFPDQTDTFLAKAQEMLTISLGTQLRIIAPLRDFTKADVVRTARELGVVRHYSCHLGGIPCGHCIACLEYGELR